MGSSSPIFGVKMEKYLSCHHPDFQFAPVSDVSDPHGIDSIGFDPLYFWEIHDPSLISGHFWTNIPKKATKNCQGGFSFSGTRFSAQWMNLDEIKGS